MQVVTATADHIDIDSLACITAYAELLQKQGRKAAGISTGTWNASITPEIRSWNISVTAQYTSSPADRFTLVDISNPAAVDPVADLERVTEIIDHHPGFVDLWRDKIGGAAQIEEVGAASTLVVERWQEAGLLPRISQTSARLLMSGILDNTLNFKAHITTKRDRAAYRALAPLAGLPGDWPKQYFTGCQEHILSDIRQAILDDTKSLTFPGWEGTIELGQLVIWDGHALLQQPHLLGGPLRELNPDWCMNLVSLKDGISYFICDRPALQQWFTHTLGVTFSKEGIARANRLWLRKEIFSRSLELYTKSSN